MKSAFSFVKYFQGFQNVRYKCYVSHMYGFEENATEQFCVIVKYNKSRDIGKS